jgi:hypothetical protein
MDRAAPPTATAKPPPAQPPKQTAKPTQSFARMLATLSQGALGAPKAMPPLHASAAPPLAAHPHAAAPRHQQRGHDPHESSHQDDRHERDGHDLDASDPTWAHRTALMAPPLHDVQADARAHVDTVARHASVEELAPQLLRKMAWSGDGKRGAARLELGSGTLSGAVVTLEADGREVALAVEGLTASEESSLRERLAEGLSARGFRLVG